MCPHCDGEGWVEYDEYLPSKGYQGTVGRCSWCGAFMETLDLLFIRHTIKDWLYTFQWVGEVFAYRKTTDGTYSNV